jgi:biopolymer transport protein ExbD
MPDMKEGSINVTPLIDIVMCLIIFYMLAAQIGVEQGARPTDLPAGGKGQKIVDPSNTIYLNVEKEIETPVVWAMDQGQLKKFTLDRLVPFLQGARGKNPEFKAKIRANWDLPYHFIEPVLVACARANVKEYQFENEEGKPKPRGGGQPRSGG